MDRQTAGQLDSWTAGRPASQPASQPKMPHSRDRIIHSNYLLQILKLHMVLFKLEMIQANNKLFFTGQNLYK
jgi:hypothetical protein